MHTFSDGVFLNPFYQSFAIKQLLHTFASSKKDVLSFAHLMFVYQILYDILDK